MNNIFDRPSTSFHHRGVINSVGIPINGILDVFAKIDFKPVKSRRIIKYHPITSERTSSF